MIDNRFEIERTDAEHAAIALVAHLEHGDKRAIRALIDHRPSGTTIVALTTLAQRLAQQIADHTGSTVQRVLDDQRHALTRRHTEEQA